MAGQPRSCGSVGEPNLCSNHVATTGWNWNRCINSTYYAIAKIQANFNRIDRLRPTEQTLLQRLTWIATKGLSRDSMRARIRFYRPVNAQASFATPGAVGILAVPQGTSAQCRTGVSPVSGCGGR